MARTYILDCADQKIVHAACILLRKVLACPMLKAEELLSVAKLLLALSRLPQVPHSKYLSVMVTAPRKSLGDVTIDRTWMIELDNGELRISTDVVVDAGRGADTSSQMQWEAIPGCRATFEDFRGLLPLVPDAKSFPEEVEEVNFSLNRYKIEIQDEGNRWLRDDPEDAEDNDGKTSVHSVRCDEFCKEHGLFSRGGTVGPSVTVGDTLGEFIAELMDPVKAAECLPDYMDGVGSCELCDTDLARHGWMVYGRAWEVDEPVVMCPECFRSQGVGVGLFTGWVFVRMPDGRWRRVGGSQP